MIHSNLMYTHDNDNNHNNNTNSNDELIDTHIQ